MRSNQRHLSTVTFFPYTLYRKLAPEALTKEIQHLEDITKAIAILLYTDPRKEYKTYEEIVKESVNTSKINYCKKKLKADIERLHEGCPEVATQQETMTTFWVKGNRALDGNGEAVNLEKAFKCFVQAAELGSSKAHTALGKMYEKGTGVKEDPLLALQEYRKGAELGDRDALFSLGRLYESGITTETLEEEVRLSEAAKYYLEAAEKGCPEAMTKVGIWYGKGIHFPKNVDKAIDCYQEAAKKGDGLAYNFLGVYYYEAGNDEAAFNNFLKGEHANCINAVNNLGMCYENGIGAIKSLSKALEYYKRAANKRFLPAMLNLANLYVTFGGEHYEKAAMWYRQVLIDNKEVAEAYLGLAKLYEAGKGVEKNYEIALKNYKIAGELGESIGYKKCGDLMYTGKRLENPDMETAIQYYRKAAELGNAEAMNILGEIHEKGYETVEQSMERAVEKYEEAYRHGNIYAGVNLAKALMKIGDEQDMEKAKEIIQNIMAKYGTNEQIKEYIKKKGIELEAIYQQRLQKLNIIINLQKAQ
eukprot:TRINITY_DN359_c0_g2_i1.p4 TRINITY_DN359_c0_g2~~TRINITY_DN359_c0_g2_i1.p4  ORF type:complete len:532 (+),score=84.88 TRINITY_DN359_c0_g2_i1:10440-12035(+)